MSAEVIDKAPYWARRRITLKEEDGFGGGLSFLFVLENGKGTAVTNKKSVYTSNTDVNV